MPTYVNVMGSFSCHLMQPRTPGKGIAVRNCLDQVGLKAHLWAYLDCVNRDRKTHLLWVATIPRKKIPDYGRVERVNRAPASMYVFIHFSLLLTVSVA